MDVSQYRERVDVERRNADLSPVDVDTETFEAMWEGTDHDQTLGNVYVLAAVIDGSDLTRDDVADLADRLRDRLIERAREYGASTTPLGYLVCCCSDPPADVIEEATTYTVAERRTNVFPIIYDADEDTVHRHEVPRLKGRGIYRRQVEDVDRLFAV
ncbi:hypothetical protein [Halorubrum vacuolatum]|uniref:Uncharacterized protein n=1 Tax=Halorubrum vacuolatum TaxID=63740 RepID=A0A238VN39_HALVU|nr:hypothetical protein [Halorubrum vacuolatum]SNR35780.1 hypothetical protein SAMN06264855_103174 [Halorubrum vacuolatum]